MTEESEDRQCGDGEGGVACQEIDGCTCDHGECFVSGFGLMFDDVTGSLLQLLSGNVQLSHQETRSRDVIMKFRETYHFIYTFHGVNQTPVATPLAL